MVDVKPLTDLRKTIERAISESISAPAPKTPTPTTPSPMTPKPLKETIKK
jgi:hypothetical protein